MPTKCTRDGDAAAGGSARDRHAQHCLVRLPIADKRRMRIGGSAAAPFSVRSPQLLVSSEDELEEEESGAARKQR